MGLHEDIISAQKIVSVTVSNFGGSDNFHNTSAVYKVTNERMKDYQKYLKNRKRILSVIASGDQILNSVLDGTREVDAFDISDYPKYFMYLKIAGIKPEVATEILHTLKNEEQIKILSKFVNENKPLTEKALLAKVKEILGE